MASHLKPRGMVVLLEPLLQLRYLVLRVEADPHTGSRLLWGGGVWKTRWLAEGELADTEVPVWKAGGGGGGGGPNIPSYPRFYRHAATQAGLIWGRG